MKIGVRGDFRTPDITREFAREILDIKHDSLSGSFPGRDKPEHPLFPTAADAEDPLDALDYRWREERAVNELKDTVKDHIRYGKFRVMEMGGEIIGFAMAMQERAIRTVAYRRLLGQTPMVKLGHLYVRSEFQDIAGHNPPVVQLGQEALSGFGNARAVSFAANEDWFVPEALTLLGMRRLPLAPEHEDSDTLGDRFDPLHIAKYETPSRIS